ncbi:BTAD domain-containing putative transcriptional regulator [Lentzea sp. HUAS TT2]|uniref:AfsR/SARP family transcriptional regulator n=1 Tax=Lentzea sp. HUAS TT2 TaxID=3447454 RepID=UPI003F72E1AF
MELVLLGGMAVLAGGSEVDLGPARQRCVLAALAVDAGQVVSVDRLTRRVWGDEPPQRARATLLNYLSRLRLLLEGSVARRPGGYALEADRFAIDLFRFRDLRDRARAEDDRQAADLLRQALELWRGEALTGAEGDWAADERDRLHHERLAAERDLTDVLLRLGHGEDLVAPLTARCARWPLDEHLAGQLMQALHHAGRTADALAHHRRLRDRLVEQLGTEPGAALRELHQRILAADPAPAPVTSEPVPRQLPAPPRWFTGREAEFAHLSAARAGTTMLISAIGGTGGIGKTWLALAWAHRHAARFPDGQLFVDLRGFHPSEQPVTPDAALFGFLTALGVSANRVPVDLDGKAALYRSLLAGQRMLVLLDNAATSEQVIPLLPGSPSCTVLITGRSGLVSLIDRHGANHLRLDVLDGGDARALLAARLGEARAAAEPGAVKELVELCGGYPLALAITARHAAVHPSVPLAEIAAELRELGLEMFGLDTDTASCLPSVLSWSLRRLTDEQRTTFALLGICPGPDTTLAAVVPLTGLSPARARRALTALEDASLVSRTHDRYVMHDLVRHYAATVAHELPNDVRESALARVMDFYLHTAHAADRLLDPYRELMCPDPPVQGVHPHPLAGAATAMAWFEAEHTTLLAAQRAAADLGRHQVVWHFARALDTYHYRRGHRVEALVVWEAALEASSHLPDATVRIRTYRYLGSACTRGGLQEAATRHLERALALAVRQGITPEQAHAHQALGTTWERRGDNRRALDHARQALRHYRTLGNQAWVADGLNAVGWFAACLGDFDTAREHCLAGLDLHREHGYAMGEASTWDSLGFIAHHTGDHLASVDHYRKAEALFGAHGHTYEVANTLDNRGWPHRALGQHDEARAAWREALRMYRDQGRDEAADRVCRQLDSLGQPIGKSK